MGKEFEVEIKSYRKFIEMKDEETKEQVS